MTSPVEQAAKECGHRHGNFWNYYRFNPVGERLRFLLGQLEQRSGYSIAIVAWRNR